MVRLLRYYSGKYILSVMADRDMHTTYFPAIGDKRGME